MLWLIFCIVILKVFSIFSIKISSAKNCVQLMQRLEQFQGQSKLTAQSLTSKIFTLALGLLAWWPCDQHRKLFVFVKPVPRCISRPSLETHNCCWYSQTENVLMLQVRNWTRRAPSAKKQSGLAGHPGQWYTPVLLCQQYRRAFHKGILDTSEVGEIFVNMPINTFCGKAVQWQVYKILCKPTA